MSTHSESCPAHSSLLVATLRRLRSLSTLPGLHGFGILWPENGPKDKHAATALQGSGAYLTGRWNG